MECTGCVNVTAVFPAVRGRNPDSTVSTGRSRGSGEFRRFAVNNGGTRAVTPFIAFNRPVSRGIRVNPAAGRRERDIPAGTLL
jgi:hypothetical protein